MIKQFCDQQAMHVVLRPGDEVFIGPSQDKRKAYAHVGVKDGYFVVIDAPFQIDRPGGSPFNYGNGLTNVPLEPRHAGMQFKIHYWGEYDDAMFTIGAIHEESGEVILLIEEGLMLIPRDDRDHALSAFDP